MKTLKAFLTVGSFAYLYVYGWAFKVILGWAGVQITILQGVLFDLAFSMAIPINLGYFALKTFAQTRKPDDPLSEEEHEVVRLAVWYFAPWVFLFSAWLYVKVLA